jgi:hypothetical protein
MRNQALFKQKQTYYVILNIAPEREESSNAQIISIKFKFKLNWII